MKLKELGAKLSTKKAEIATSATAMVTAALSSPVFAADETTASLSTAMTDGLNNAVSDFVAMVGAVLPIGLTVFTATFAVKKGMKFFKNISNS